MKLEVHSMRRMIHRATRLFLLDVRGQDFMEFALIAAFISVMGIAIYPDAIGNLENALRQVSTALHKSIRGANTHD